MNEHTITSNYPVPITFCCYSKTNISVLRLALVLEQSKWPDTLVNKTWYKVRQVHDKTDQLVCPEPLKAWSMCNSGLKQTCDLRLQKGKVFTHRTYILRSKSIPYIKEEIWKCTTSTNDSSSYIGDFVAEFCVCKTISEWGGSVSMHISLPLELMSPASGWHHGCLCVGKCEMHEKPKCVCRSRRLEWRGGRRESLRWNTGLPAIYNHDMGAKFL